MLFFMIVTFLKGHNSVQMESLGLLYLFNWTKLKIRSRKKDSTIWWSQQLPDSILKRTWVKVNLSHVFAVLRFAHLLFLPSHRVLAPLAAAYMSLMSCFENMKYFLCNLIRSSCNSHHFNTKRVFNRQEIFRYSKRLNVFSGDCITGIIGPRS